MEQTESILSREFKSCCAKRLDVRDLIDQSRSLISLIFPWIKLKRYISELIHWKNLLYSFLILIFGNILIIFTTNVVFLSSASLVFAFFIFMGIMHRKTGILKKVFPSENLDEYVNLPHDEAMHDLRTILVLVDSFVYNSCLYILKLYAILRWENLAPSIIINIILFGGCIILSILPLRFFFLFGFNISFGFYPLLSYFTNQNKIVDEETKSQEILVEETYSHNSELDAGFATDSESSVQCSISSDEEKEDERKTQFIVGNNHNQYAEPQIQQIQSAALPTAASVGEQLSEETDISTTGDQDASQAAVENVNKADVKTGANTKVNALVGKLLDLKKRRNILHSEKCSHCGQLYNTILRRKNICSNCGYHFCAKCCNFKVPRSKFGATAPAAQTETASVCSPCYESLTQKNVHSKEE